MLRVQRSWDALMIESANLALRDIFSPPFRGVLVKSLALTITLLAALWLGLQWAVTRLVETPWDWLDTVIDIMTGVGLLVGLGFLAAPAAALFIGFFLDEIAEAVERTHYPRDPIGRPLPPGVALFAALKFFGIVVLVNALALPLVLLLGFGALIFLVANAYLLGREYFELVASRRHERSVVRELRQKHALRIFAAGLLVALLLAIPFANVLVPLFATAFMVHLERRLPA
jgi:CysZ protein